MSPKVAERGFEEAIECALFENGPDACAGDTTAVRETLAAHGDGTVPGGYRRRRPEDCDRGLCLLPRDVVDFPDHRRRNLGMAIQREQEVFR